MKTEVAIAKKSLSAYCEGDGEGGQAAEHVKQLGCDATPPNPSSLAAAKPP